MKKLAFAMSMLLAGNGVGIPGTSVLSSINEITEVAEVNDSSDFAEENAEKPVNEIDTSSEGVTETTTETEEALWVEETESAVENSEEEQQSQLSEAKIDRKANALQTDDGYWLVGDAATLRTYITTDKKKQIRLTADIDLGTLGYALYDGFVLDGGGYTVTYDKAGNAAAGFYLQQTNATVTMKNVHFGTPDGLGATGYYGIITGYDANPNMKMIFENITYTTINGQAFYNPNGQIIFRGNNIFSQIGSSGYAQEFAEANYLEVESGTTKVTHNTTNTEGFIYVHGTNTESPYANSGNVIVRSGAAFDVETSHAFMYSSANYNHTINVEDNANLRIRQIGTGATRRRFIYPDLGTDSKNTFYFGKNSQVQLDLKIPLPLSNSKTEWKIEEGADYEMTVESGKMFSQGTSGTLSLNMNNVKKAVFSGTEAGILGIRTNIANTSNLSYNGMNRMKVSAYDTPASTIPVLAFNKKNTDLYINNTSYQNISGDTLSPAELNALALSQRLEFTSVWVPDILTAQIGAVEGQSAEFSISLENYGFPVKEIDYFLYTKAEDIGIVEKAKHIYNSTNIEESATAYSHVVNDLNPNTTYWMQAIATNSNGPSDISEPIVFKTEPVLQQLEIKNSEDLTETTAKITGNLANNTGFWTDYTAGAENPLPNQPADYGASYDEEVLTLEYSRTSDFFEAFTVPITHRFGENESEFTVDITDLRPDTTYYTRVKTINGAGREIIFPLVYEFKTVYGEYIDVSIPVEMLFGTDNKEVTTEKAGTIYGKEAGYEINNQGNVNTAVYVTNFTPKNEAAQAVQLLDSLDGVQGSNQLALTLLTKGNSLTETFLTPALQSSPALIGTMDTENQNLLQLDFSGRFFNPLGEVMQPEYTMTLKFEKSE